MALVVMCDEHDEEARFELMAYGYCEGLQYGIDAYDEVVAYVESVWADANVTRGMVSA